MFERSIIDLFWGGGKMGGRMGKKQLQKGQLYIVSYDTWDDCIDLSSRVKTRSSRLVVYSNYNFSNYIVDVTRTLRSRYRDVITPRVLTCHFIN